MLKDLWRKEKNAYPGVARGLHGAAACASGKKASGKRLSCEFVPQTLYKKCSMNNKNPEKDIRIQPEDQKSKAAKPLERSMKSPD